MGAFWSDAAEYQERYASFLHIGIEELERSGVSFRGYERNVVNHDRLPEWLEMVGDGMTPAAATATMAADAGNGPDESDDPVAAAWTAVGRRWEALLDGVCLGYPRDLVAVFHRYGWRNPLWRLVPHASIEVGELDWVVARLPAAARPALADRRATSCVWHLVTASGPAWTRQHERHLTGGR